MEEVRLGILKVHVQNLFATFHRILLNSGFRENGRLTARTPLPKLHFTRKQTQIKMLRF